MSKLKIVSPRAELAVIRGMCHRNKKIAGTLVANTDDSYFYSDESVELYKALRRYIGEHGESPTYKLLIEDSDLSNEARSHLRDSQATIQTVEDAVKASQILNKYRQTRLLYNLAASISDKLKSSKIDMDTVLQDSATAINVMRSKKSSETSFLHFGKHNNSTKLVSDILYEDNSDATIPTGIAAFDEVSGGFARGSLVTLGANSGAGKSAVANAMGISMAAMGYKVLIVPLEMSKREMTARIIANVTKTDLTDVLQQKLSTGDRERVFKRYRRWAKRVKEKGGRYTIFKPEADMDIEEIMVSINAYDCDVVIIDYISLLKGVDGDDQWRALGAVARYAKINAEVTNRVNILLCQVNEDGKIRYARAISEHSTNSFIWVATKESKETGITKIEQPKSRNSASFPFLIKIVYNEMRIESVDMGSAEAEHGEKSKRSRDDNIPNLAESDV